MVKNLPANAGDFILSVFDCSEVEASWAYHILQGIFLTQGLNLCLLCFWHWQVNSSPLGYLGCSVASVVSNSATPWTAARQAPLSMGFSRQEHWSGLAFPTPGPPGKPCSTTIFIFLIFKINLFILIGG